MAINLELILHAYACYRPDIGYVQGMSYIAAMVVYYMDEFSAFKCLANILARRMSFDFYQLDNSLIDEYTETFNFFFELRLPLLCEHFSSIGLSSSNYLSYHIYIPSMIFFLRDFFDGLGNDCLQQSFFHRNCCKTVGCILAGR